MSFTINVPSGPFFYSDSNPAVFTTTAYIGDSTRNMSSYSPGVVSISNNGDGSYTAYHTYNGPSGQQGFNMFYQDDGVGVFSEVVYAEFIKFTNIQISAAGSEFSAQSTTGSIIIYTTILNDLGGPALIPGLQLTLTGSDGIINSNSTYQGDGNYIFEVGNPNTVTVNYTVTNSLHSLSSNSLSVEYIVSQPTPSLLLKASDYNGSGDWINESNITNSATLQTGTIAKNAAGNGIVLDGQTSWIFPDLNLGNAWTVNVWYKHVGPFTGNYCILSQKYSDGQPLNMFIGVGAGSANVAGGFLYNTGWQAGGPITLPNEWTNIQITWDGTNMKTYILGSLTSSVQINYLSISNGMPYDIGRCDWGTPGFMEGELGEVRVYNFSLTQEQVTADFQESVATFINPLTPYGVSASATSNSFTATWLGGTGATSYTFTLNGSSVTSSVSGNSATFTGLTPSTNYTLIVTAVGSSTQSSSPTIVRTLAPPPSLIHQFIMNGSVRDLGTLSSLARVSGSVSYINYAGKDCVQIDSGEKINISCILSSSSSFTISFWIIMNAPGSWSTTQLSLNDGINGIIYFLGFDDSSIYAFSGNNIIGSAGAVAGSFDKTYFANIAVTYSDGNVTTYVNGIQGNDYTYANSFTSTQITIGSDTRYSPGEGYGTNATTCYIRQLCIYDAALSTSDISALYTSTQGNAILNMPSDPLTPYGPNISSLSTSSFNVNWLGGTGASSYEYTLNGIPVTPTQGQNSASLSGLESSTEYTFVIRSINS